MPDTESPAVARRRVRLALRAARLAKKLTQSQVARAMDWSLSKVIRIEKGEVNVSPSDLKVLLSHLDVTDPEKVQSLLDDARVSRQERWTVDPGDREHITPALIELVQFEAEAIAVRYYCTLLIPGPLQTPEYAEAIFANSPLGLDPATIAARIDLRQRRRLLLYRKDAPAYYVILDESVLHRSMGGAKVMAEQFNLLLTIMADTSIQIRVIPLDRANLLQFLGPFTLVDVEEGRSAIVYRESPGQDEIVQAQPEVARHRRTFDQIWDLALDHADSVKLLARRAAQLKAQAAERESESDQLESELRDQ